MQAAKERETFKRHHSSPLPPCVVQSVGKCCVRLLRGHAVSDTIMMYCSAGIVASPSMEQHTTCFVLVIRIHCSNRVLCCSIVVFAFRQSRLWFAHVTLWLAIGLYRDVWIAAIASSRTSLATLMGVMCNTSQCELRSLRVKSGMLNVICIVTYYTLRPLESPDSFWIAMAFSR